MQKTTDTPKDPEAILLSRVYAMILSWGPETDTPRAEVANARKTRKTKTKREEGKQ